jgi:hypothetical protein
LRQKREIFCKQCTVKFFKWSVCISWFMKILSTFNHHNWPQNWHWECNRFRLVHNQSSIGRHYNINDIRAECFIRFAFISRLYNKNVINIHYTFIFFSAAFRKLASSLTHGITALCWQFITTPSIRWLVSLNHVLFHNNHHQPSTFISRKWHYDVAVASHRYILFHDWQSVSHLNIPATQQNPICLRSSWQ